MKIFIFFIIFSSQLLAQTNVGSETLSDRSTNVTTESKAKPKGESKLKLAPESWSADDILANAITEALVSSHKLPNIREVLVSIPMKFRGKGVSFENWPHSRPPVIAVYTETNEGTKQIVIKFDHTFQFSQKELEIAMVPATTEKKSMALLSRIAIPLVKDIQENFLAEITGDNVDLIIGKPGNETVTFVHPKLDFGEWFPLYFRRPKEKALKKERKEDDFFMAGAGFVFPAAKLGLKEITPQFKKCHPKDKQGGQGYSYCLTDVVVGRRLKQNEVVPKEVLSSPRRFSLFLDN